VVDIRRVRAEPVTADAWAPFGWLPLVDTDPDDGDRTLHFEWGDPHANVISHGADEIEHVGDALRCDRLYRHDTHTQALLVLNVDAVVAVAPAGMDFAAATDADSVRAFLLRPLDRFVLHAGTWHWGPFPLGNEPVQLFNIQGLGYRDDNASVDLAAHGLMLDVVVP
jgi:ureidoglycolate hydrolase